MRNTGAGNTKEDRIDRRKVIDRNNPIERKIDRYSVLSVGNGDFAFSADVTGLQTLGNEYQDWNLPLCTMSTWGWHRTPVDPAGNYYSPKDLVPTTYLFQGRKVQYPVKKQPGNEEVYDWLRKNPHKFDLYRLAFLWENKKISSDELSDVWQELHLYTGVLESSFLIHDVRVQVETVCDQKWDIIGVRVKSDALADGRLQVALSFGYPCENMAGVDWTQENRHLSRYISSGSRAFRVERSADELKFQTGMTCSCDMKVDRQSPHCFCITVNKKEAEFVVSATPGYRHDPCRTTFQQILQSSQTGYEKFWQEGGIVDCAEAQDPRAAELERRIILSLYLLKIQCTGNIPPQETGLTCNSWYGKQHLEMYFWHCAYLPLWGHTEELKKSLNWYVKILPQARMNAKKNGYRGARWPKMVAYDGVDSPSGIAPLLIWQQPHLIYILDLLASVEGEKEVLIKYWKLIKESAEFMADYAVYNRKKDCYELLAPLIPAQERFDPVEVKNPTYETAYWRYGLVTAARFAMEVGENELAQQWKNIGDKMAELPMDGGKYLSIEGCQNNFTVKNIDHPSMLAAYGVLSDPTVDKKVMRRTLETVLARWQYPTLWGWDFAVMAMTAARLSDPGLAMNILLRDTLKNQYVVSGHNYQKTRKDLPLYLPGNGSLLLAIALLLAGSKDAGTKRDGVLCKGWKIRYEGIHPFPF